ncbi:MAG TPA: HD domain-containing protein [Firmicutes bacterium]|nr:HD domain-containing protein [Candidatus Fermentithermobacillaceae bacterium]
MMDYSVLWAEVERELDAGSHDLEHVRHVYATALRIGRSIEDVNPDILLPAAILHDIARRREDAARPAPFDHAEEGAQMARAILETHGFPYVDEIYYCIRAPL